ncbi:MAG: hypothetical protein ACOZAK_00335 [Patescibacteria group bacterium]
MKKPINVILLTLISLIVATASTWFGWQVAANNLNQPEPENQAVVNQKVEVYFYRTDGIYRVTSDQDTPQKIVETNYDRDKPYYFSPSFDLMGENSNWLVYKDVIGKNDETNEVFFGLVVYDMTENKPIFNFDDKESSVTSLMVSPNKNKLVFVVNRKDPNKEISQGHEPFYQELLVWDGKSNQPEKVLTEASGFFGLGLGIWLDNETITLGRGYEGISYCKFNLTTDKELPQNCEGYGSSSYGGMENLVTLVDGWLYGYRYEWSEMTGTRNPSKGIFKQQPNNNKIYLSNDVPSDLVVGQNQLYYLRSNLDSSRYIYNGVDSDLYLVAKDGSFTKRLTNDGNSVMAKSNLDLSSDQRFISYQITDISNIPPTENNLETTQDNSTIWLYDTQLNKYYQIAEKGLAPQVVVKNLTN